MQTFTADPSNCDWGIYHEMGVCLATAYSLPGEDGTEVPAEATARYIVWLHNYLLQREQREQEGAEWIALRDAYNVLLMAANKICDAGTSRETESAVGELAYLLADIDPRSER